MIIKDIYKVEYMKNKFSYIGTLRNGKLFNINDNIFFNYADNRIIKATVVGIELLPSENPSYKYKLVIPEEVVAKEYKEQYHCTDSEFNRISGKWVLLDITCDKMFNTVQEAKESAIQNLECMIKLQAEEIERYFEQFGLTNNLKENI